MAYYIFSNFSDKGHQNYSITPKCGFLHPQEVILITVAKYVSDSHELETLIDIEDLVFVKALPLNEERFNADTIGGYDIDETFHDFNVSIMFTLEAMTTEFVTEPVDPPDLREYIQIENTVSKNVDRRSIMKELVDDDEEEEQKTEHSELLKLSEHNEPVKKKVKKISFTQKPKTPVREQSQQSEEQSEQPINEFQDNNYSSDYHKDEHYDAVPIDRYEPLSDQQVGRIDQEIEPDEESQNLSKVGNKLESDVQSHKSKSFHGKLIKSYSLGQSRTSSIVKKNTYIEDDQNLSENL